MEQAEFETNEKQRRQAALQRLLALDALVVDWPNMEAEIEQGLLANPGQNWPPIGKK